MQCHLEYVAGTPSDFSADTAFGAWLGEIWHQSRSLRGAIFKDGIKCLEMQIVWNGWTNIL